MAHIHRRASRDKKAVWGNTNEPTAKYAANQYLCCNMCNVISNLIRKGTRTNAEQKHCLPVGIYKRNIVNGMVSAHAGSGEDGYSYYQDTCTCVTPTSQSAHESKGGNGRIWGAHIFIKVFFFCFFFRWRKFSPGTLVLSSKYFHSIKITNVVQNCKLPQNWQVFGIAFLSHKLDAML